MSVKDYLQTYRQKTEPLLDEFFSEKIKEASQISPFAAKLLENYHRFMKGGKMIRGALTLLGYQLNGQRASKKISQAGLVLEIIHSFLLIHDDFIDRDELRRGKPTLHKLYALEHGAHYGNSMAVVAGDIGSYLANELFFALDFAAKTKKEAFQYLSESIVKTAYGEAMEIHYDYVPELSTSLLFKIKTYKTAYYTVVMPLVFGAKLAGADPVRLENLEKYGLPVGLAFQLQDDILGTFGHEEKTGKSGFADIREGKKTLLYTKALELAPPRKRLFLLKYYGSPNLGAQKIEIIRRIIKNCGSFDWSQKKARRLVEQGKSYISLITKDKKYQKLLADLAHFVIERQS